MAPFTARNHSSGLSSLATLDGGAAWGYMEVLPVERSVAIPLPPGSKPVLPSRACRHSSALTGSAYVACGEAASSLHAMALLQVHQAKALKDQHEGGHDPEVLSELRTATDLALRATTVTPRSLGRAMSTMVAQQFSAAQNQTEAIRHILPRRAAAASTRPLSTRHRGRPTAAAPPVQAPTKPGDRATQGWG